MSEAATKLLEQILALPEDDRAMIRNTIDESLGDEKDFFSPDYRAELGRRIEAIENGTAELIDGEQFFRARLRPRKV